MNPRYSVLTLLFIVTLGNTTLLAGFFNVGHSQELHNRDQLIDSTKIIIDKNISSLDSNAAHIYSALQQNKKSRILQYYYSKKLIPNESIITELSTATEQSNKASQIQWNEFTKAKNSEFAQAGYSTPGKFVQIAGDVGETTAWGILAAQAFENGNNANFIASSLALLLVLQRKYGLLDRVKFWH